MCKMIEVRDEEKLMLKELTYGRELFSLFIKKHSLSTEQKRNSQNTKNSSFYPDTDIF